MADRLQLLGRDLRCVRGGRNVFDNLDFSVSSGELLAVTGRNGVGKSSLLRLIAGLIARDAGSIELVGGDPDLSLAEQAHFLGHRDAVKPSLTVLENVSFWFAFLGGEPGRLAPSQALDAVGLGGLAALPAAFLSAGQRRRLSIARLIAIRRPVWLLDEPTTALDDGARATVASLIANHLRDGGLIVAATHQPLGIEPSGFAARELRMGTNMATS